MTKRAFTAIVLCLFLISFILPAFYVDGPEKTAWSNSVALFFLGWIGVLAGSFSCISWLANPLFIIAVILFLRTRKLATFISLLATLFAASFLLAHTIIVSEAPTYASITGYGAGYWLWLASMVFLFILTIVFSIRGTP